MRILRSFCIGCVKAYRYTLAPLFMSLGVRCRFTPSCSEYAIRSLESHGVIRGLVLALRRLIRCQPFCAGGHDPVPEKFVLIRGSSPRVSWERTGCGSQKEISHG